MLSKRHFRLSETILLGLEFTRSNGTLQPAQIRSCSGKFTYWPFADVLSDHLSVEALAAVVILVRTDDMPSHLVLLRFPCDVVAPDTNPFYLAV
jgi:hypothetical protein